MDGRKTTTSTEVKMRWINKTYNRYSINLRKDSDADIIQRIEDNKCKGISPTETIREMIRK